MRVGPLRQSPQVPLLVFHHVEQHGLGIEAGGPDGIGGGIRVAVDAAGAGDLAVLGLGNLGPSGDVFGLGGHRVDGVFLGGVVRIVGGEIRAAVVGHGDAVPSGEHTGGAGGDFLVVRPAVVGHDEAALAGIGTLAVVAEEEAVSLALDIRITSDK